MGKIKRRLDHNTEPQIAKMTLKAISKDFGKLNLKDIVQILSYSLNSNWYDILPDAVRLIAKLPDKDGRKKLYEIAVREIKRALQSKEKPIQLEAVKLIAKVPDEKKRVKLSRNALAQSNVVQDEVVTYIKTLKPDKAKNLVSELTRFPHLLTWYRFRKAMKRAKER